MLGILIYFSVQFARFGLASTDPFARGLHFVSSGLLMLAAGSWMFSLLRRKWKTGRFLLTRDEAMAKHAEYRKKMGAGKPLGPQAKYWIFPLVLMAVLFGLGVGAIVASTCTCSDGSQFSLRLRLLLWALAATLMVLPGWFAFKTIQRKVKTGSFLPSQEELAKARAKCAAPKPLKQRILLAALYWLVAILWTIPVFRGHPHSGSSVFPPWTLAALWWLAAAVWTAQIFRPSRPQCALPELPSERPMGPQAPSA